MALRTKIFMRELWAEISWLKPTKKSSLLEIHLKLLHSHPRQYRRADYITLNGLKESEESAATLLIAYIIKHMVSVSGLVQI